MQHITIKDIAKMLNVSVATVSRAFNSKYDIKKETRERVLQAAKELGYRPNPIAKKLLQKKSYNIGVIVPEFINSFFPEVIMGIQEVVHKEGYQVIILQSSEDTQIELSNIAALENSMVDGVIISLTKESKNIGYFKDLIENRFPIVFFNRFNESLPASKVVLDDYKWALFATEHLIEQGYKNIFHFAGPQHLTIFKNRRQGYSRALEKHKLSHMPSQIIDCGITFDDGTKAMEKLIREKKIPDAIFAINDPTALGAMTVLKKHGFKIPDEIGIVGFSDSKTAMIVEPSLTTVCQPTFKIGQEAAQLLLEQLNASQPVPPKTVKMEGRLIIRESSVRLKSQEMAKSKKRGSVI